MPDAITLWVRGVHAVEFLGLGTEGYEWIATSEDPHVASVRRLGVVPGPPNQFGEDPEIEVFQIRAHRPGCARITFDLIRRWEQMPDRSESILVTVR
jgi:Chagasin family peptidase inhibitor I42